MARKISQEEIIRRFKEKHGDAYDYGEVEYRKMKEPVKIICNRCFAPFEQTPANHLAGNGCPNCRGTRKRTAEEFIKEAVKIHSGKYSYERIQKDVSRKDIVEIICPNHGVFKQRVDVHLAGSGCRKCVGVERLGVDCILKKAGNIHPDLEYLNRPNSITDTIEFKCKNCGNISKQLVSNHIYPPNYNGCPHCAPSGFKKDEPAVLYYIKDKGTGLHKVGVTNRSIQERFRSVKDRIEIIWEKKYEKGRQALEAEKYILQAYKPYSTVNIEWSRDIGGHTEFFTGDVLGKEYS